MCPLFILMEVAIIANDKDMLANDRIKFPQVFVIGPNGEQLGLKTREDALTLASYAGLDLVLMNATATPPVCKLMDYNKFKYEKKKKIKENQKKARETQAELKEYRLSPTIDIHDFNTKKTQVRKYLEKNAHIKVSIRFKGRQLAHTELGKEVLIRFAEELSDVATIEQQPKLEGRTMTMLLVPKK